MLGYALRAVGMYFLALLMIRVLGKRALGELGPFDFVVMTGVGHMVVSIALDKSIPFYEGIVILATLAVLEFLVGFVSLKNQGLSNLITGKPIVLIENGKILKKNLAREKFNVDDLLQELRKQGIRDVNNVEKGILESCGGFSVILRQEEEALTRKDMGIYQIPPERLQTFTNITRGEIFAHTWYETTSEGELFSLPETIAAIQEKLDYICGRLEALEKK
ncbi:MAG TPA: YetF domain-containing protein [Syntrophomonadaceae bacterium]|nr:YetF domain-containing protein [Syntrophomonadaceae bacterium]